MDTKANILIVDDDTKASKTLSDIVRARGYVPRTASKGRTALHIVEEDLPAVAILELVLEDMSGIDVMKGIKECCPRTECIVFTGNATKESVAEAVNLGAYAFVGKPYDVEQLLLLVQRANEKSETEAARRDLEESIEELQHVREELEQIVNLAVDIIAVADPSTGYFTKVNPAFSVATHAL